MYLATNGMYFLFGLCFLKAVFIIFFIPQYIAIKMKHNRKKGSIRNKNKHNLTLTCVPSHRFNVTSILQMYELIFGGQRQNLHVFSILHNMLLRPSTLPILFYSIRSINIGKSYHPSFTWLGPKPTASLFSYVMPSSHSPSIYLVHAETCRLGTVGKINENGGVLSPVQDLTDDVFSEVDSEKSIDTLFAENARMAAQLRAHTERVDAVLKDLGDSMVKIERVAADLVSRKDIGMSDSQLALEREMKEVKGVHESHMNKMTEEIETLKKRVAKSEKQVQPPNIEKFQLDSLEGAMLEHRAVTMVRAFKTPNGSTYCAVAIKRGVRISGEKLMKYAASKVATQCLPEAFLYDDEVWCGEDRDLLPRLKMEPMTGRPRVYKKRFIVKIPVRSWWRRVFRNRGN